MKKKRMILTGLFLLFSGTVFLPLQGRSVIREMVKQDSFYYFSLQKKSCKIPETQWGKLKDFALKSCNMRLFLHAGKICGTFAENSIPCPGYRIFVETLVRQLEKTPSAAWEKILEHASIACYGKAGNMMLAFFREKVQEDQSSPIVLARHQMLFDMMEQKVKNCPEQYKAVRCTRAELDLLTLYQFEKAKRFRMSAELEQIRSRCWNAWEFLPGNYDWKGAEYFRKQYQKFLPGQKENRVILNRHACVRFSPGNIHLNPYMRTDKWRGFDSPGSKIKVHIPGRSYSIRVPTGKKEFLAFESSLRTPEENTSVCTYTLSWQIKDSALCRELFFYLELPEMICLGGELQINGKKIPIVTGVQKWAWFQQTAPLDLTIFPGKKGRSFRITSCQPLRISCETHQKAKRIWIRIYPVGKVSSIALEIAPL